MGAHPKWEGGVPETGTEAHPKRVCNQTDSLTRQTPPNPPKGGNRVFSPGGQTAEGKPDGNGSPSRLPRPRRLTKLERLMADPQHIAALKAIEERGMTVAADGRLVPKDAL